MYQEWSAVFHHPLTFTNAILDPIYGLVRMTDEERRVVDHRLFQRLRNIRQNGMLHLVFPSATHTRFEHCIGVLSVADSMLQSLYSNSMVDREKLAKPRAAKAGQAVDFSNDSLGAKIMRPLFRVARLAALVHDLGHGPLSHAFESFAPRKAEVVRAAKTDGGILAHVADMVAAHDSNGDQISHEELSCLFFAYIWADLRMDDRETAVRVAGVLLAGSDLTSAPNWLPLARDIISSAPADADRLDYLERDSRSCGVSYGLYDRQRLLKSILCYKPRDNPKCLRLGWKKSGLRAIENFVQARFQLFVQVYYHKTNKAVEEMLNRIAAVARRRTVPLFDTSSFTRIVDTYCDLSEDRFLRLLRGRDKDTSIVMPEEIVALAGAIQDRRLWKRVYEFDRTRSRYRARLRRDLAAEYVSDGDKLQLIRIKPEATKGLDSGAVLLERDAGGNYAEVKVDSWRRFSPVIATLESEEKQIWRLYLRDTTGTRSKRMRKAAIRIAATLGAKHAERA